MAEQQKKPQKEQDINQLLKVRREKLANLQAEGKDPFVITKYDVTHHSMEIKDNYDTLEGKEVSVAGRMMFAAGIIGAAGSFVPNEIAKFVLVLAPMAAATIIPTVLSWRWYRAEQQ